MQYLVVLARTDVHAVMALVSGPPVDIGAGVALLLVWAEASAQTLPVAVPVRWDGHPCVRGVAVLLLAVGGRWPWTLIQLN